MKMNLLGCAVLALAVAGCWGDKPKEMAHNDNVEMKAEHKAHHHGHHHKHHAEPHKAHHKKHHHKHAKKHVKKDADVKAKEMKADEMHKGAKEAEKKA